MTISVSYPNEGDYTDGKPRWEQKNSAGQIVQHRIATPEEAMFYGLIDAMWGLAYQVGELQTELRNSR